MEEVSDVAPCHEAVIALVFEKGWRCAGNFVLLFICMNLFKGTLAESFEYYMKTV